jgi:hypothetical protein
METEVQEYYDSAIAHGKDESEAAFEACYEWDLLDYEDTPNG